MDWPMEFKATSFTIKRLVSWIQNHPVDVVQTQQGLSQETHSLLDARLKTYRQGLGSLTPLEQLEQNNEAARAIQYICAHNYLYFLELIQRYDLIRELFQDTQLFAKELLLIDELELYHKQMQRKQHYIDHQNNQKAIERAKPQEPINTLFTFNQSYMDLLVYYEIQIVQIERTFHQRQIHAHQHASNQYRDVLEDTTNALFQSGCIDAQKKIELEAQWMDLHEEEQVIQALPEDSLEDCVLKNQRYEAHTQKLNAFCHNLLNQCPDTPEFDALKTRVKRIEKQHRQELKHHLGAYGAQADKVGDLSCSVLH